MTADSRAPEVGSILADRYKLVRRIARGGMGEVFEAEDRQLGRRVAVKVFRSAASGDRLRFDAEVVVLARLSHPGLVQVFDAGEQSGDAYVVLELIDGPTLRSVLANRGPLPAEQVAAIGLAVADALAYVHGQGVVHRDVTPSNVLCDQEGRPRLADFGIARLMDTTRVTRTATTVGTVAYMSPEQVQGRDVTPAADVYSLGLVLLELLTGQTGFVGSAQEVAVARLVRPPDVSGAPAAWRPLLAAMTHRAPDNRATAAEAGATLAGLAGAAGVPAGLVAAPLGERLTEAMGVPGGTMVMPAPPVVQLVDEPAVARVPTPSRRLAAALLVVGLLVVALAAASQSSDNVRLPTTPTTTDDTVTDPVAFEPGPTTTAATAPATTDPPGRGKGKGDGKDRDDD